MEYIFRNIAGCGIVTYKLALTSEDSLCIYGRRLHLPSLVSGAPNEAGWFKTGSHQPQLFILSGRGHLI